MNRGAADREPRWKRDNQGVTLNLDTTTALRTAARYRELVKAVYEAPSSAQETQWLEWKREGDPDDRRWRAELSRQVLGMANRDPDVSAVWCGGCAYVLLGVAPGHLIGTRVHDASKIESWLSPFVGRAPNAPEWNSGYVEVDGKHVLVLTIEAPQWGHPIWICRREFRADPKGAGTDLPATLRDGAVYVRHKASTEEANSVDYEMLQRRLLGKRRRVGGISLVVRPGDGAISLDANDETLAAWAKRQREALTPPPPTPPRPTMGVDAAQLAAGSLAESIQRIADMSSAAMSSGIFGFEADPRTEDEYRAEVESYITKATKVLPAVVIRRACERGLGLVRLSVENNTDDPIRQLQIVLTMPQKGLHGLTEGDLPDAEMPKRPVMLGKGGSSRFRDLAGLGFSGAYLPSYDYLRPVGPSIGPRVRIDNSNSTTITFAPVDLYAQDHQDLDEFYLLTSIDHTGNTLSGTWTARARDASGVQSGSIEIDVDRKVPTIEELLTDEKAG